MPGLTEAGYRTHFFDLHGYGLSERPRNPEVDTSITGQVTDRTHRLQAAIPGPELRLIEPCGLAAPEEQPREVAAGIVQFLDVQRR